MPGFVSVARVVPVAFAAFTCARTAPPTTPREPTVPLPFRCTARYTDARGDCRAAVGLPPSDARSARDIAPGPHPRCDYSEGWCECDNIRVCSGLPGDVGLIEWTCHPVAGVALESPHDRGCPALPPAAGVTCAEEMECTYSETEPRTGCCVTIFDCKRVWVERRSCRDPS